MPSSRKRICWVVASPLTIGFFLTGHIARLSRQFDLTIITKTGDPHFLDHLGENIRVLPLEMERNVSPWKDLKALIRLIFIFRRERYDLVHTLSPKSGLLAMVASWVARTPLRIHTFQGEVWITRTGWWRALLKTLDKWMARCATHLLVVSRSEAQFLVDQKVVPAGRMEMLANGSICGVDVDRFKPDSVAREAVRQELGIDPNHRVILFVGRFNVDKGLLDLAAAFERLAPRYPDTCLLLVGPDEERMRPRVEGLCAEHLSRLRFVGHTAHPERYMAAADMLCLPSYREGFGLVLIEAAATGLPTVGSRIYGISDAIADNQTGLLFEMGNIDDLTDKLDRLLHDPALAQQLGEAGQKRARQDFPNTLVESALLGYYKQILSC